MSPPGRLRNRCRRRSGSEPDVAAGAAPEIQPAPERPLVEPRTDITVAEMREWLRNWIANATGQSADTINDDHADGGARPVVT